MATTTYGSPYVDGTDLVANWPAASLTVAQSIDAAGYYIGRGNNTQTGSYTTVLTDAGKVITMSNASANTVTIPANSSVAYVIGTRINILNLGAGACTPTAAAGVTINGTITALATNQAASVIKTATNTWSYVPFSSGVGAAVYSDANTGTYTGFAYKTYTGSGTLNVTTAGFADVVVIAGGGGGNDGVSGGGGAGGVFTNSSVYLPVGLLTVTVGAGGAAYVNGNTSLINLYYGVAGGSGAVGSSPGGATSGGSGGGGGGSTTIAGGSGVSGQGFAGGSTTAGALRGGSGGGGAGAVGVDSTSGQTGKSGGAGVNITIAGTTPSGAYVAGNYAVGGGGGGGGNAAAGGAGGATGGGTGGGTSASTAGAANKGGGGGGGGFDGSTKVPSAGGSGIVIVRVAV